MKQEHLGDRKDVYKKVECKKCEHAEDLKGCATKHIGEARRLLFEGDVKEADLQLSYVERHLKEEQTGRFFGYTQ